MPFMHRPSVQAQLAALKSRLSLVNQKKATVTRKGATITQKSSSPPLTKSGLLGFLYSQSSSSWISRLKAVIVSSLLQT